MPNGSAIDGGLDVAGITRRSVLAGVLLGFGAGRAAGGGMSGAGARLEVQWSQEAGALMLRYRLANAGAGRLVVFDRVALRDEAGRRVADPLSAWVTFAPEGGAVVDKLVPQIPDSIDVMNPEMPYARLVRAGEVLEGRAVLRLPLQERTPYGLRGAAPGARTEWVQARIGFAALPDHWDGEPQGKELQLPWGEAAWLMRHAWASVNQQVLVSPRQALQVSVLQP